MKITQLYFRFGTQGTKKGSKGVPMGQNSPKGQVSPKGLSCLICFRSPMGLLFPRVKRVKDLRLSKVPRMSKATRVSNVPRVSKMPKIASVP